MSKEILNFKEKIISNKLQDVGSGLEPLVWNSGIFTYLSKLLWFIDLFVFQDSVSLI